MKQLENPLTIYLTVNVENGEIEIAAAANYGISSDDVHERRGLALTLTPEIEAQSKAFARDVVLPQIREKEGL